MVPDGDTYLARTEFLPLVFLADKRDTPAEGGGRCLRVVARGLYARWSMRFPCSFAWC